MAPSVDPMITSVVRALRHSGGRKAGTPFEMASTPVTAAPPEAKAWSTMKSEAPKRMPSPARPKASIPSAASASGSPPVAILQSPTRRTTMLAMKK